MLFEKSNQEAIAISTRITIATTKCNQKSITIAAAVAIINCNAIAIVTRFFQTAAWLTPSISGKGRVCVGGLPPLPTQILHPSH
jgi:hypothetical protein